MPHGKHWLSDSRALHNVAECTEQQVDSPESRQRQRSCKEAEARGWAPGLVHHLQQQTAASVFRCTSGIYS